MTTKADNARLLTATLLGGTAGLFGAYAGHVGIEALAVVVLVGAALPPIADRLEHGRGARSRPLARAVLLLAYGCFMGAIGASCGVLLRAGERWITG